MTSLTEVYEGGSGGADPRRLYLGVGLFLAGVGLVLAGIVVATTGLGSGSLSWWQRREVAGVLAGLGIPAVLLGIVSVLPASRVVRSGAVLGAAVAALGVLVFYVVYPDRWVGDPTNYSLAALAIYFLGATVSIWCLFAAVATFTTRNDPGGTVTLEVTRAGETRVVNVEGRSLSRRLGGIGLLGATPDGDVETQTARPAPPRSDGGSADRSERPSRADPARTPPSPPSSRPSTAPVTDRPGARVTEDAELLTDEPGPPATDAYCGNCEHFRYVRTDGGLEPFCDAHGAILEDMDPCPRWEAN
jgi:hypothetical protein